MFDVSSSELNSLLMDRCKHKINDRGEITDKINSLDEENLTVDEVYNTKDIKQHIEDEINNTLRHFGRRSIKHAYMPNLHEYFIVKSTLCVKIKNKRFQKQTKFNVQ